MVGTSFVFLRRGLLACLAVALSASCGGPSDKGDGDGASSGSSGSSGSGGRGGGAGATGAGGTAGRPGGAGSGGNGTVGIRCGADDCDPATDVCGVDGAGVARCGSQSEVCPAGGGCVVLRCDGDEDCDPGETCRYSQGENEYFICTPAGGRIPCTDLSDCPAGTQECRNFARDVGDLGWQPRYCTS